MRNKFSYCNVYFTFYDLVCNSTQAERITVCGMSKYLRAASFFTGKQLIRFTPPGKIYPSDSQLSMWNKSINNAKNSQAGVANEPTVDDNDMKAEVTVNTKRLADLLEAVVGAFFVSGGLDSAKYVLTALGFDQLIGEEPLPPVNLQIRSESTVPPSEPEIPEGYPPLLRKLAYCSDENSIFVEYKQLQQYRLEINLHHESASSMLESEFGYSFRNEALLVEAFTHPSVLGSKNNQRLEFLGDAVLDVAVVEFFYRYSDSYDPGQLTNFKTAHTNNVRLGTLGLKLGFHRHLVAMSEDLVADFKDIPLIPSESLMEAIKESTLHAIADCFEALIGAIFLDCGESLAVVTDALRKIAFLDPKLC